MTARHRLGPPPSTSPGPKVRVLFIAANPSDTARLADGEEYREIERRLRTSLRGAQFELRYAPEVRGDELAELLRHDRPQVVHFSGHGSADGELLLPGAEGRATALDPAALTELFGVLSDEHRIPIAVLNACHSARLATLLKEHVDCVIGVPAELPDRSAIAFAGAFYEALGSGSDVEHAWRLACAQVKLVPAATGELPSIYHRPEITPKQVRLVLDGAPEATAPSQAPRGAPPLARWLVAACVFSLGGVFWPHAPTLRANARVNPVVVLPDGELSCPRDMVRVPAGEFMMGSSEGQGDADEYPQHRVRLGAFCLDRTEVTVAAYNACVRSNLCEAAATTVDWPGIAEDTRQVLSESCNRNRQNVDDHPVNCVNWYQAQQYCLHARFAEGPRRLPTEAEWEFAARGTDGRIHPWGTEPPSAALLNVAGDEYERYMRRRGRSDWTALFKGDDGWATTAPVGSYLRGASPFGALDMAGNVWEWTADLYSPYAEPDASTHVPVVDPQGPPSGTLRVRRGGGFDSNTLRWFTAVFRRPGPPTNRIDSLGFRCARSPR